jgi:hypothetical protein
MLRIIDNCRVRENEYPFYSNRANPKIQVTSRKQSLKYISDELEKCIMGLFFDEKLDNLSVSVFQ